MGTLEGVEIEKEIVEILEAITENLTKVTTQHQPSGGKLREYQAG